MSFEQEAIRTIEECSLFDPVYYVSYNGLANPDEVSPAEHYFRVGGALGYNPHPLFDTRFYQQANPGVTENPLVHYQRVGFRELRNPHPLFDVGYYFAQRPDVMEVGMEPLSHYLANGWSEGSEPHWLFSGVDYLAANPDVVATGINPLLHYVQTGVHERRRRSNPTSRVEPAEPELGDEAPLVKLIAFYLPQFHPFEENDAWWGRGFTEWTNVSQAVPQYDGHYQPHVPADLGFYDLRLPAVQRQQVDLARTYGLGGFCFYFYWFAGKRLMEEPIRQFAEQQLGFPFCLCWANENWTRRWDGLDADVLIAQNHSPEDDLAFIGHLADYLRHPDYIRIGGKPLVMVYRPSLLPDAAATAHRWREWCRTNDIGEIYLAYTQSFEATDPRDYGFDAAVEFPPNNSGPSDITEEMRRKEGFSGTVYDYRVYPKRSLAYTPSPYTLFRGVFPSWDNEARRRGRGVSFHHASPDLYEKWLRNAVADTVRRFPDPDRRLVFVNAWNEWAEGAHLEPDQAYGHAWLEATRAALCTATKRKERRRVVLVTHDCYTHGAQYLALNIAKSLARDHDVALEIVTLGDGPLKGEFANYGSLHDLAGIDPEGPRARALAADLAAGGCTAALVNTAVGGLFLKTLTDAGLRTVALIHEMPDLIRDYKLERHVAMIARHAERIVFPSQLVLEGFAEFEPLAEKQIVYRSQGLYKRNGAQTADAIASARARVRDHFKLAPQAKIVLGVGYADRRKGIDLFVDIGAKVMRRNADAVFIWVGQFDSLLEPEIRIAVEQSGFADRFIFTGFQPNTGDFYAGADVFALTSREDPFPTVVLEALDVRVPGVAFQGSGGMAPLLDSGCGLTAEAFSSDDFSDKLLHLLENGDERRALGSAGKRLVDFDYSHSRYVRDLLKLLDPSFLRVSVIAPNYNYARYLPERLRSVDGQTLSPYEIIVLDDSSTDDSQSVLEELLPKLQTASCLMLNTVNSGSVFRQWRKGVARAAGDLIWIAEVDDLADPEFLATAVKPFTEDPTVVLSFTQSKMIDETGEVVGENYLDYVADVDPEHWLQPYSVPGIEEIRLRMAIKNTIPNASGAVFRADALREVLESRLDEISSFKVAGDWIAYVRIMERGRVTFSPEALNLHRRHRSSVTISTFDLGQLKEIVTIQALIERDYAPPPERLDKAAVYVERLIDQFNLDKATAGSRLRAARALVT